MNYALVGSFVLVLGAVLVAGLLWLASGGAWQQSYDVYLAVEDESVAGLNLNAPVKYNGVDVGKVQAIALDKTNPLRVNLLFAIERGTPVKEDTLAILKTQGLTGIAYVELSGGSAASPPLQVKPGARYPQIKTAPSLSARLENVLTNVLAKLDSTSNNINAILSTENQIALKSILADGAITLNNTAKASAKLDGLADRIGHGADAVTRMGTEVAKTSISAGKTVDVMGADVKRFSTDTLPELERLLGELSTLSSSLRRLTEQTRRDPSGLIFGRTPVPNGPGESGDKP